MHENRYDNLQDREARSRRRASLSCPMIRKRPSRYGVATALASGCDVFLTGDRRFKLPATITKEAL